jgi:CRP-like cAMP-binding protein
MEVTEKQAQELFRFLPPVQVMQLNQAAEPVSFKSGETVYRRGERATFMYVVISGKIALLAPGDKEANVLVNELGEGKLFGVCVCVGVDSYTVTAKCVEEAWLLRIKTDVLKKLMEDDFEVGYALQKQIAQIYFRRYANSTRQLSAIVSNIPMKHV